MALADRIVVMHAGEVMQFATPQTLYRQPANEMVARFIDDGRVVPVSDIEPDGAGQAWVTLFGQRHRLRASPDQRVRPDGNVCLHAPDLQPVAEDQPGFCADVRRVVYRGSYRQLEMAPVADPHSRLALFLSPDRLVSTGDRLRLSVSDGWVIPS